MVEFSTETEGNSYTATLQQETFQAETTTFLAEQLEAVFSITMPPVDWGAYEAPTLTAGTQELLAVMRDAAATGTPSDEAVIVPLAQEQVTVWDGIRGWVAASTSLPLFDVEVAPAGTVAVAGGAGSSVAAAGADASQKAATVASGADIG